MPSKNLTLGNLYTALGIAGIVLAIIVGSVRLYDGFEGRLKTVEDRTDSMHNRWYADKFPEEEWSKEYRRNHPQFYVPY